MLLRFNKIFSIRSRKRNFSIERMIDASEILLGKHDFRSFMSVSGEQRTVSRIRFHPNLMKVLLVSFFQHLQLHPFFALRTMDSIKITPGRSIVISENFERTMDEYEFWDIEFVSKSYVYRQVRRMVAALIGIAEGRITKSDLYEMLTIPSKHSWQGVGIAPPHGLYLKNVEYPPKTLDLNFKYVPMKR